MVDGQGMTLTSPGALQRLAPLGGPLAGRTAEMDVLRRAWAEAVGGRCRVVLLAGEPGVGKSRLAAELAGEVEDGSAAVLVGSCPAGGAEPYHPLVEALGPLPATGGQRQAMFDAIATAVAARARRSPVLLVLDDLHRADRSTLLALGKVVEAGRRTPLLLLATYRDTALDRSHPLSEFLAAMLARPEVERVNVGGLSPDAIVDMVGDRDLARRLWRHSEGNPVRVGELLRLGALDRPLPPNFDELVARRVEVLKPAARKLLEAAAVAGTEFDGDVVAAAVGVSADQVSASLKQLGAAGFIVEEPAERGDRRRFVHDLVREAIERLVQPGDRVRLHQNIGRLLEDGPPAPAALLAWHFRAAAPVGGSEAALRHSARAAERAMELLAWEEAAVHYGHALAAAAGVSAEIRADLLLSLGEAQRQAGETARARQAFLEAATLARSCADGARMARAALALGQVAAVWGADPELEELAGEARALLGGAASVTPEAAPAGSADFTDFASDALYDVLDGVPRPPAADPGPVVAPVPGHHGASGAAALLRARHVAMAGPEHVAERLATAGEAVALGEETGDDEFTALAHGWRMVDLLELGRLDEAAGDQAAHARLARSLGQPRHAADAATWFVMRAALEGRVDEARSAAAQAFALASEAGDPEADESFLVQRWWLALDWGTGQDLSQVAPECGRQASTGSGGRAWRAIAGLALARAGDLELAAEELRRVTDHGLGELIRHPDRLHALASLAETAWILGDGYRAAAVGPLLEPYADQMVVAGRGLVWRGSVARACGLVAAAGHRWDEAERHFQVALTVHRRTAALPLLARTRYEWSTVLDERGRKGDRRKAAESRRKAADLAGRLGMARLAQEMAAARP